GEKPSRFGAGAFRFIGAILPHIQCHERAGGCYAEDKTKRISRNDTSSHFDPFEKEAKKLSSSLRLPAEVTSDLEPPPTRIVGRRSYQQSITAARSHSGDLLFDDSARPYRLGGSAFAVCAPYSNSTTR